MRTHPSFRLDAEWYDRRLAELERIESAASDPARLAEAFQAWRDFCSAVSDALNERVATADGVAAGE
jgi:hypothetical protein